MNYRTGKTPVAVLFTNLFLSTRDVLPSWHCPTQDQISSTWVFLHSFICYLKEDQEAWPQDGESLDFSPYCSVGDMTSNSNCKLFLVCFNLSDQWMLPDIPIISLELTFNSKKGQTIRKTVIIMINKCFLLLYSFLVISWLCAAANWPPLNFLELRLLPS